jgi:hypothetical protein
MNRFLRQACVSAMLCTLMIWATPGFGQSQNEQYQDLWRQVATALVSFSNANLAPARQPADPAARAAACRRAEERFSAVFTRLSQMNPPRELLLTHWQLVPLLEQLQAEMKAINKGAEQQDEAMQSAGWAAFRDTLNLVRLTVEEEGNGKK